MSPLVAIKSRQAWLDQARDAEAKLREAGATDSTTLLEMADVDYQAFCLLVEAFYALGVQITQEILDRAKMRPVDDVVDLAGERQYREEFRSGRDPRD